MKTLSYYKYYILTNLYIPIIIMHIHTNILTMCTHLYKLYYKNSMYKYQINQIKFFFS